MTDPRRLLEGGDADLGATLLRAAQIDAPPETSRKRAAAALGLTGGPAAIGAAGGGGGAAATATATATAAKVASTGIAIKWLGAGVAGLAMVSAASSYRAGRAQRVTPSVAVVSTAAPRVASAAHVDIPPPEPIPSTAPLAPIAPLATGAPLAALPSPSPSPSPAPAHSIGREVAMLDSARTALAEGHAEEAIHRLDAYARSCPDGALTLEANVVRVEALEADGNTARAATLAQQLLAKHPDAPQAAHLRSLVRELQGETDPTNP